MRWTLPRHLLTLPCRTGTSPNSASAAVQAAALRPKDGQYGVSMTQPAARGETPMDGERVTRALPTPTLGGSRSSRNLPFTRPASKSPCALPANP